MAELEALRKEMKKQPPATPGITPARPETSSSPEQEERLHAILRDLDKKLQEVEKEKATPKPEPK